jgi:hypothetical protein
LSTRITDKIQTYGAVPAFDAHTILRNIPLEIAAYPNAFVSRREIIKEKDGVKFESLKDWYSRGAIYDERGVLLPDFRDPANPAKFDNPLEIGKERISAAARVEGKCIYLGTLHGHFGHFLIESMARAWGLLRQEKDVRALFHFANGTRNQLFHDPTKLGFPKFVTTVLDAIGIGAGRLVLANKDMVVEELLVPTPQFVMEVAGSPGLGVVYDHIRDTFRRRSGTTADSPKKIYLTRTALTETDPRKARKSAANEKQVEALFAARGFEIVCPERLPFEEQVALVSNATHIAGTTGSALHMIVFNDNPDAQVIAVDWRAAETQYMLEAGRGLRAAHILCFDGWTADKRPRLNIDLIDRALTDLMGQAPPGPKRSPAPKPMPDPGTMPSTAQPPQTASRDATRAPRPTVETPAARRLLKIAAHIDARSYVEIGVAKGSTFNRVAFPRKVAVDPTFRFNVEEFQEDGVEFVQKTSDDFFLTRDPPATFDLVFLDGLHRFEQTFRDFCNSLSCAHSRTVWLIDDVWPVDVFSSLHDYADAVDFRRKAGVTAHAYGWHGDVYKVVLMIHDFFPSLSYVTISTGGNPQTIVWRSPRTSFTPVFQNAEAITRVGYFDLMKLEKIINLMPEAEAFKCFFESMCGNFSSSTVKAIDPPARKPVAGQEATASRRI